MTPDIADNYMGQSGSQNIMNNEDNTDIADNSGGYGILYLCATPIGNLGDITYRAVATLQKVDLIAAEDTRHTHKLLSYYDIKTPMISYHEHNKQHSGEKIIAELKAGKNIALVSDAGMPAIADPGEDITRLAVGSGIEVRVIPGANAALTALITSGLIISPFTFIGFLPRTGKRMQAELKELAKLPTTLIFYEAPHRLKETLANLIKYLGGNRRASLSRELTKKFEEHRRGTLNELATYHNDHEPRGEYVIVVGGKTDDDDDSEEQAKSIEELYAIALASVQDKKEAMRQVAKQLSISRRAVYQHILDSEKKYNINN